MPALMLEASTALDLPLQSLNGGKIKDPGRGASITGVLETCSGELGAIAIYQYKSISIF